MALEGGLRDRMILESILQAVVGNMTTLGWFEDGRKHKPIRVIDAFPVEEEEPAQNTLAFSLGDTFTRRMELGTNAEEFHLPIFIDFFAESDGLGRHVIGDIYYFFARNPTITVYDYDKATPSAEFTVEIHEDTLEQRRPDVVTQPWQKHWNILALVIRDDRANS